MYVSHEPDVQMEARLLTVIALADFVSYDGAFEFVESSVADVVPEIRPDAVAIVRDDDVWSQLVPCARPSRKGKRSGSNRLPP